MKKETIEIIAGSDCWLARYPGNQEIIDLFGTDTLPTAFTPRMAKADVIARLKPLNPRHQFI